MSIKVQREINLLNKAIAEMDDGPERDRYYAAQQALVWVMDPGNFARPLAMLTGVPDDVPEAGPPA